MIIPIGIDCSVAHESNNTNFESCFRSLLRAV